MARWEWHYSRMPAWHKALLPGQPAKYAAVRARAASNAAFFGEVRKGSCVGGSADSP